MIIDQELELGSLTYQIDGFYTKVSEHQEKDERGATMFREDEISIEIESITFGDDFEHVLSDKEIQRQLEELLISKLD